MLVQSQTFMPSGICSTNPGVNSSHMACSPLCFLLLGWGGEKERRCWAGKECGPPSDGSPTPLLLSYLSQAKQAGQGWPEEEVSQILAQLQEQVEAVTSPSDALALVGTMTVLAKVVAELEHSSTAAP